MNRTLPLAAAFALSLGCDSPGLLANIDTLACAMIPWYVADCTEPEVHDKAVSVIQDGIVAAQIECTGQYLVLQCGYGGPTYAQAEYKAQLLQDGSCFVNHELLPRRDPAAAVCESPLPDGYVNGDITARAYGGNLVISSSHQSCYYNPTSFQWVPGPTPDTVLSIAANCTGFNLEAFD